MAPKTYADLLKEKQKSNAVKPVGVTFRKWKTGDEPLVGELLAITPVQSSRNQGVYNMYTFLTDTGPVKFALGTVIDTDMAPLWQLHAIYLVEYLGREELPGGNSMHRFDLKIVQEAPQTGPEIVHVDSVTGEVVDVPESEDQ